MATFSLFADTNLDAITGRTGADVYNINTITMTIDTDTRWCANAPSGMVGTLGNVNVNTATGGKFFIDATKTRWLAYDTGSGTVPAIGTSITQSGVTGELLGVWANYTSAPTAVGASMPTTGFIKFRSVTGGAFSSGALTGIGANATGADKVGWIEVVMQPGSNVQNSAMGEYTTRGDWFELGTTNGTRGQTIQLPTNGGGSGTNTPAIWIETGVGTGVYEHFPSMNSAAFIPANLSTDERSKFVEERGGGVVRIGHNGSVDLGYLPPSGCKIRVPNIFQRQALSGSKNQNVAPDSNINNRARWNGSSSGNMDLQYVLSDWCYQTHSLANSVIVKHCAIQDTFLNNQIVLPSIIDDFVIGNYTIFNSGAYTPFRCISLPSGGKFTNITAYRLDGTNSGYVCQFSGNDMEIDGYRGGIVAYARITNQFMRFENSNRMKVKNVSNTNSVFGFWNVTDLVASDIDHTDRFVGSTNATSSMNGIAFNNVLNATLDRVTVGLKNVIPYVNPYGSIVTFNNCSNIRVSDIGSKTDIIQACVGYEPAYAVSADNICENILFQRCYITKVRTRPSYQTPSVKGMTVQNVYTGYNNAEQLNSIDQFSRGVSSSSWNNSANSNVNGSTFIDLFTSATTGLVALHMNAPSTARASYYTTSFSNGAGFSGAGYFVVNPSPDYIIFEMPYYAKGHTGFQNTAMMFFGTDVSRSVFEYQLDVNDGTGWNGTWKTITGANLSAETITPNKGFKLKVRVTGGLSWSNQITRFGVLTTTTTAAQMDNVYPDSFDRTYSIAGLVDNSIVKLFDSAGNLLKSQTITGGATFKYDYNWNSEAGDKTGNFAVVWHQDKEIIKLTSVTFANENKTVVLVQKDDIIYTTPASNVSINFTTKRLNMTSSTDIDVAKMYSYWKDQMILSDNAKYALAFSTVGNNQLTPLTSVPVYLFLLNSWKIKPNEANYTLGVVNGILIDDSGTDPFVNTTGSYTVRINYQQPVNAITVATHDSAQINEILSNTDATQAKVNNL